MMYTMATQASWDEFIAALRRGDLCEIEEKIFWRALDILPPAWQNRTVNVQGVLRRCDFGFVEGWDYVDAYWRKDGKFYCQKTTEYWNTDK